VSLRQDAPDAADLAVSLAALKDWTFLLGPGFIVGWGNGLILGYLMYSSRPGFELEAGQIKLTSARASSMPSASDDAQALPKLDIPFTRP
jgi:hypothetical protein